MAWRDQFGAWARDEFDGDIQQAAEAVARLLCEQWRDKGDA